MGRPPCCDKEGVKKGPWTPEEDILLVSYIQEHGPGNWRNVPSNAGLRRCSKSCRLRWTNYLRPGIKRGDFTDQEEKMIIHLQALLGNRWAAIASYLPERTDNDIKNYWNTHLRKKLKKLQSSSSDHHHQSSSSRSDGLFSSSPLSPEHHSSSNRGQWERRLQTDINMAKQALCDALSTMDPKPSSNYSQDHQLEHAKPPLYASNAENIARLLQSWVPKKEPWSSVSTNQHSFCDPMGANKYANSSEETLQNEALFRSLFGAVGSTESPNSDLSHESVSPETGCFFEQESKPMCDGGWNKLSMLEKWLFDDDHYSIPLQENANFL